MKPQAAPFFPLHVFRGLAGILARIVVVVFIIVLIVPSGYSLWYDDLSINVEVYTADFTYPRSVAYWESELQKCLQGGSLQTASATGYRGQVDTDADVIRFLRAVGNRSDIFEFNGTDVEVLNQAIQILGSKNTGPEAWLKAELLALWLNEVSGYTDGHELLLTNGTLLTAVDIIDRAEKLLLDDGGEDLYYSMALVAEEYNTRWERDGR